MIEPVIAMAIVMATSGVVVAAAGYLQLLELLVFLLLDVLFEKLKIAPKPLFGHSDLCTV